MNTIHQPDAARPTVPTDSSLHGYRDSLVSILNTGAIDIGTLEHQLRERMERLLRATCNHLMAIYPQYTSLEKLNQGVLCSQLQSSCRAIQGSLKNIPKAGQQASEGHSNLMTQLQGLIDSGEQMSLNFAHVSLEQVNQWIRDVENYINLRMSLRASPSPTTHHPGSDDTLNSSQHPHVDTPQETVQHSSSVPSSNGVPSVDSLREQIQDMSHRILDESKINIRGLEKDLLRKMDIYLSYVSPHIMGTGRRLDESNQEGKRELSLLAESFNRARTSLANIPTNLQNIPIEEYVNLTAKLQALYSAIQRMRKGEFEKDFPPVRGTWWIGELDKYIQERTSYQSGSGSNV